MKVPTADGPVAQLHMPGLPTPVRAGANASPTTVWPGREVLYVGKLKGGPRFGARGLVKETLGRRAVVDMGRRGTWRIPYYYLAVPLEADPAKASAPTRRVSQTA